MLADYTAPDFVHHFSRETLISLELTLDWAEEGEDEHTAVYAYRPVDDSYTDDEDESTPRLTVQLVPLPKAAADTLDRLSDAMVSAAKGRVVVLSRGSLTVDGLPARLTIFEHDADGDGRTVRYQVFVQWDEVVFSFSGTCPPGDRASFVPQFEAAVRSARIVPVGR